MLSGVAIALVGLIILIMTKHKRFAAGFIVAGVLICSIAFVVIVLRGSSEGDGGLTFVPCPDNSHVCEFAGTVRISDGAAFFEPCNSTETWWILNNEQQPPTNFALLTKQYSAVVEAGKPAFVHMRGSVTGKEIKGFPHGFLVENVLNIEPGDNVTCPATD